MTESKKLFPQIPNTKKPVPPEEDVILLTRISTGSAASIPAINLEENLHPAPHTLDGSKNQELEELVEDLFKLPLSQDEDVLVLEKRTPAHTLETSPSPLFKLETESAIYHPEQSTEPAFQEEELLHEMSQELFAAGHISHPLDLPNIDTKPINSKETRTSILSVSHDDLPWGPSEPLGPSELSQELSVPFSAEKREFLSIELTPIPSKSLPKTTKTPAPFENRFIQNEPATLNEPIIQNDLGMIKDQPLLMESVDDSIKKQEEQAYQLSSPVIAQAQEMSTASTHVDLELADNIFLKGILDELIKQCGRACIFACQASLLHGLQAKGAHQIAQRIHSVLFPAQLSPTFTQVIQTQSAYIGNLPENASDQMFAACLGGPLPSRIAIYPIIQKEQVVALYTLDDLESSTFLENQKVVDNLIRRALELDYEWHPPDLIALLTES